MKKLNEKNILEEVLKDCNCYEIFMIKLFSKIFIKVYKTGITYGFNNK